MMYTRQKERNVMKIQNTKEIHLNGVKLLVYSFAGAGKTSLIQTMPNPIILSAESGLLSLSGVELPYIEIKTINDLREAYTWLTKSDEAKQFDSVALDSLSEIAEVVLTDEKQKNKDGRAAYGEMQAQMIDIMRAFRDLNGKHVYMSAKCEKAQDETGRMLYAPMMPGNKLAQNIPYLLDEVLALRVEKDTEGKPQRMLLCGPDGTWTAKDRSGKLAQWEVPDLTQIINKITGVN